MSINNGYFHIICPVKNLPDNPKTIRITVASSAGIYAPKRSVADITAFTAPSPISTANLSGFVAIRPDAFDFDTVVWSDSAGNYSIELPERTYSNIAVVNENYGVDVAESWAWHIILDADQRLDFKVGTGEVYNLKVWPNNGGFATYFISFRPMDIAYYRSTNTRPVSLNGNTYTLPDHTADLEPGRLPCR